MINDNLVEITESNYPVVIDLKYGTSDNLTGVPIYKKSICLLHKDVLPMFEKAIILADQQGFKFKIFDAFRPKQAVQALWDFCPDPNFLANPANGSHHNRGVAIDLTLLDKNGDELDMGTPFDSFSKDSFHGAKISKQASLNRYILLGIMISAGWDFYMNEWWHFQSFNPRSFPLIDNSHGMM
jgi:D-alanyl-D-alanine dipeptidase